MSCATKRSHARSYFCRQLNVRVNKTNAAFHLRCMYVGMHGHTYSKSMAQPGKVANPARGQLDMEIDIFLCPRSRLIIRSRETCSSVPSRVSLPISILRLNLVLTNGIPPEFRDGVQLFVVPYLSPRRDILFALLGYRQTPFFRFVARGTCNKLFFMVIVMS